MLADSEEKFIGGVAVRDERDCLRPFQRGAFAIGIKRSFAPGVQLVQPLLGLAKRPRVFGVHIDAISAAVDLRRAHFQQMDQFVVEPAGRDVSLQRKQGLLCFLGVVRKFDSLLHGFSSPFSK